MLTVARYQQYMQKRLKEFNLGLSEYPVLIYLVHHDSPDANVSQANIAKRQYRDPALITRSAHRLAEKGFITIETAADNRARHILRLTEHGREVARAVDEVVWEWEERAYEAFTEEERRQLKRLLAKLNPPE